MRADVLAPVGPVHAIHIAPGARLALHKKAEVICRTLSGVQLTVSAQAVPEQ